MMRIEKPWGYEDIWAKTNNYVGKILVILPKQRMSLQYHEEKEETVYVMSGTLRVWSSKDESDYKDINVGGIYHVMPGTVHRFGNSSSDKITKLVEVSTAQIEDIVRISDDYGR